MKLGLVTAILDQMNYEQMMDTLSDLGFPCAEVACWPSGKAERRYAGVSQIHQMQRSEYKGGYRKGTKDRILFVPPLVHHIGQGGAAHHNLLKKAWSKSGNKSGRKRQPRLDLSAFQKIFREIGGCHKQNRRY